MLNLPIAMLKFSLILFLLFQGATAAITSPQTGDTLRGQIEILGQMDVPNFASAELAFTLTQTPRILPRAGFPSNLYTAAHEPRHCNMGYNCCNGWRLRTASAHPFAGWHNPRRGGKKFKDPQ
jgi:hypothetical protein